jgi:hypothetical protein
MREREVVRVTAARFLAATGTGPVRVLDDAAMAEFLAPAVRVMREHGPSAGGVDVRLIAEGGPAGLNLAYSRAGTECQLYTGGHPPVTVLRFDVPMEG